MYVYMVHDLLSICAAIYKPEMVIPFTVKVNESWVVVLPTENAVNALTYYMKVIK